MKIDIFEVHYHLINNSHSITRNKCESEILAIVIEMSNILDIKVDINSIPPHEGGFRDLWKLLGENSNQITLLISILTLVMSMTPTSDPEADKLDKTIKQLTIEEKNLSIQKLKKELGEKPIDEETVNKVAKAVEQNLKITKRKSNFYSHLAHYHKINQVGFNAKSIDTIKDSENEKTVPSFDFYKFILRSNKLSSEKDDSALIEIISPVLKEGKYKWKGIYNNIPISFDMNDYLFREEVLSEKHSFKHGTTIQCELMIGRELNEVGDISITGYTVITVIEFKDGHSSITTPQGLKYKHAKKISDSQGELF